VSPAGGVKAHQIFGVTIMISGLGLFLVAKEPTFIAGGGMVRVDGFIASFS
jgi:hypothetical protein